PLRAVAPPAMRRAPLRPSRSHRPASRGRLLLRIGSRAATGDAGDDDAPCESPMWTRQNRAATKALDAVRRTPRRPDVPRFRLNDVLTRFAATYLVRFVPFPPSYASRSSCVVRRRRAA